MTLKIANIETIQSQTFSLSPFETKNITLYWSAESLEPGDFPAEIKIYKDQEEINQKGLTFYLKDKTEEKIEEEPEEEAEEETEEKKINWMTGLIVGLVIIIVVFNLVFVIYIRKRRQSIDEQDMIQNQIQNEIE